jgi:hypothetical protein
LKYQVVAFTPRSSGNRKLEVKVGNVSGKAGVESGKQMLEVNLGSGSGKWK